MEAYETHLHQHALEEEESQLRDDDPAGHMDAEDKDGSLTQTQMVPYPANNARSLYCCGICGKSYTYLVSFQKHQKIHEEPPEKPKVKTEADSNLRLYECPDCGMSFIRRTRLVAHLRVHRSKRLSDAPRCDQCNRVFASVKSWMAHVELHKERRFWCLSCAQGFATDTTLDKHLQSHSLRQQNHNADPQGIHKPKAQASPPKMQAKTRAHHCPHCGKRFWRPRRLFRHRLTCKGRVVKRPVGSAALNKRAVDIKTDPPFTNGENLEIIASTEELQKEENMQIGGQGPDSEDSDCGEPGHDHQLSEPDCHDDCPGSEDAPAGGEVERAQSKPHRGHKYWEWECIECDMGFDEVAKLHSHYIKHATGELVLPKEEIEG